MSEENLKNETEALTDGLPEQEPFIPPGIMLLVAAGGAIVALYGLFTQGTGNILFWGGLGFTLLALIAWVLLSPEDALNLLAGRWVRFGGVAVVVAVVVFVAMIAIYRLPSFLRERNIASLSLDLTAQSAFSLTEQNRAVITALGADPNVPPLRIQAFYGPNLADQRDQHSVLFNDIQSASNGKITFEFIDIDLRPDLATVYRNELERDVQPGEIFVVPLGADGNPDFTQIEAAGSANLFTQEEVATGVLRAAVYGDFRAYFVSVEDGLSLNSDMTILRQFLEDFGWTVEEVEFLDLLNPGEDGPNLNDPEADGTVLVIPGGSEPLGQTELTFVQNYLNGGGALVLMAGLPARGESTLATDQALSQYLFDNFGLFVTQELVLDRQQTASAAPQGRELLPFASTFASGQYITGDLRSADPNNPAAGGDVVIFQLPYRIQIDDTPPANVAPVALVQSGPDSYIRSIVDVAAGDTGAAVGDTLGPFPLVAASENTATGARVVIFGSDFVVNDQLIQQVSGISNSLVVLRSFEWSSRYNEQFGSIPPRGTSALDTPIFLLPNQLAQANFIVLIGIPFGILIIGGIVWWSSRERGSRTTERPSRRRAA